MQDEQWQDELLFKATRFGDLAGVEEALRNGANVDTRARSVVYRNNETSLHAASGAGHLAIARVLLDAGADIQAKDSNGGTPLHHACRSDQLEVVRELIRRGADIYAMDELGGRTPFDCSNGHLVKEFLLQHNRQKFFENLGRLSLLTILECGNYRDSHDQVVLMIGTVSTDELLSMLRYFVEQDPDCIRERDHNGDLPLHVACRNAGRKPTLFQAIQYLVQQDPAMLHISNNNGALPIHLACQSGASLQAIKYLVEENGGAGTLCARDSNGALPLHVLCGYIWSNRQTIEYLTNAHPAALWTPNSNGALPLHSFCATPHPLLKAVEGLIKPYPAALSTQNHNGDLPVTLAGELASLSVIYTLVRGDPQVVCPEEE